MALVLLTASLALISSGPGAPVRGAAASALCGAGPRSATPLDRRALLRTASSISSAALAAALLGSSPRPAQAGPVVAPVRDEKDLKEAVVLLSRLIEATEQEERLINSGKYKDLQRKSVKNAATMMIDNYSLQKNLVRAAIFVPQDSVAEASRMSQEALEALTQIVGYFPAELSIGELERPQKEFVLRALTATRTNLLAFLALLPANIVQAARDQVREENKLNASEYQKILGEPMLNMPTEAGGKGGSKKGGK